MKSIIRKWNCDVFGWIDLQVCEKVDNLNALDRMIDDQHGEDISSLVEDRYKVTEEFRKTLKLKECMLRLKSRQLWLNERDKNTRFFHKSLKTRRRRNAISAIMGRNGLVEWVDGVKEEVKHHFEEFFRENSRSRPESIDLNFKRLSEEDSRWFDRPFTEAEVKDAVWDCDGNKSLGPDGFSFAFFKNC
ncbi:uncharacterized protein LOC131640701 [Vicia villosa]|uniref:uncharacterized protein LOC131640701 n=1 Tax=Vicia villosa TaxID=3911 RepID=UPI00273C1937|nr:uncharacterized protein LOC131640701 [Vicia villosa]